MIVGRPRDRPWRETRLEYEILRNRQDHRRWGMKQELKDHINKDETASMGRIHACSARAAHL